MDLASLRERQQELAASVIREDRLDREPPRLIGGADVGFEQEGEVTRAAIVLLAYPSLELVEYQVARVATTMPYIPGFSPFVKRPRCWRRGNSFPKTRSLICRRPRDFSSPAHGRRQPFWPAGGCPDHWGGEKRLCGRFTLPGDEPGHWRR